MLSNCPPPLATSFVITPNVLCKFSYLEPLCRAWFFHAGGERPAFPLHLLRVTRCLLPGLGPANSTLFSWFGGKPRPVVTSTLKTSAPANSILFKGSGELDVDYAQSLFTDLGGYAFADSNPQTCASDAREDRLNSLMGSLSFASSQTVSPNQMPTFHSMRSM